MASNPLAQSDEDFLNEAPPAVDPAEAAAVPSNDDAAAHDAGDPPADDPVEEPSGKTEEEQPSVDDQTEADAADKDDGNSDEAVEKEAEVKADEAKPEPKPEDKAGEADESSPSGSADTFSVPTSFQANGKTITLKDADEATKLMQMGANYTRKMMEIAPHRKVLMMLQNNDLLDESRLSFLIDLDKRNPEAIKKLIKDAGIDPNEIDLEVEPDYLAGAHTVTDDEVSFRTVMEDLSSTEAGVQTIGHVNKDWDNASKEILWKQPELLTVIHEQREAGVYDQIRNEVDRQRTLGKIPANMPFLAAYKQVGDEMVAAATDTPPAGQQPTGATEGQPGIATPAPTPVVTRTAAPKANVKNGDKVSAASPTRAVPGQAKVVINPLAMSDDAFLKEMENRL